MDMEQKNTLDRIYSIFKDDNVDIILFGHSHQPMIKTKNKTLIINPGSPSKNKRKMVFLCGFKSKERENRS